MGSLPPSALSACLGLVWMSGGRAVKAAPTRVETYGRTCMWLALVCGWLREDIRVFKYVIFKRFIRGSWGFEGSGAWFVTTVCSQAVSKGVTVKVNVARDPPSSNLATVRRCLPDKRANSTN